MKLPKFSKEKLDVAPMFILSNMLIAIPLFILVMYAWHRAGLPSLLAAAA